MGKPLECTVNAGKSLQPTPTTGTPSVSRYSSVRGKSRNDFAPAHTVTTGCAASAPKSAEMSPCSCESRCTPPIPPVANTPMPARLASNSDAETVVAPTDQRCAMARAISRSPTFLAGPRMRSCSDSLIPTRATPSMTAVIAGTAPASRMAAMQLVSAWALAGDGKPRCEKIVDSSATTARLDASASRTSSLIRIIGEVVFILHPVWHRVSAILAPQLSCRV